MAENKENPISIKNIPYEILYQIVSLIPLKEAARTIILSSSWKHLWTPVQVFLNMDSDRITTQESGQQMNQIISSFLNTYETSYQILNLSFLEPKAVSKENLFFKAIKGVDKELHICFNGELTPTDFSLTIELPLCENVHICSLKTLHLRSITSLAGSFLPELFSACWNLETLTLEKCSGLQDIDLKAHGFLQKFMVLDCENMESVTISSAPNLKSFCYRGTLVKTELKDVPTLYDVTLNFKGTTAIRDHSEFDCADLVLLLVSLRDVVVLTVSGWLLASLCTRGVIFDDLDLKFNELKELSWIDCCMNKQKRDSLVCFLSITPTLENLFIKQIDKKRCTKPCSQFHQSWPHVQTNEATNDWQLKHMKVVKFLGFIKIEEQNRMLVSLMDVLLKKAIAMKKMSVTEPEKKLSWSVAKVPRSHLKKMEEASTTCHPSKSSLLLSSLDNNCCFRLTPADENGKLSRFT